MQDFCFTAPPFVGLQSTEVEPNQYKEHQPHAGYTEGETTMSIAVQNNEHGRFSFVRLVYVFVEPQPLMNIVFETHRTYNATKNNEKGSYPSTAVLCTAVRTVKQLERRAAASVSLRCARAVQLHPPHFGCTPCDLSSPRAASCDQCCDRHFSRRSFPLQRLFRFCCCWSSLKVAFPPSPL